MSELDIKVTGDNTEAIQSIKDTIALLNTLKSASESVSGGNIKSAMAELKAGINSIRPNPELGKVTEFLNGVAAFKLPKGLASLSERLDDIGTGMNSIGDTTNLTNLAVALDQYARVQAPNLNKSHATALGAFAVEVDKIKSPERLGALADGLTRYAAVEQPKFTRANAKNIGLLAEGVASIHDDSMVKLFRLAEGLRMFNELSPEKLSSSATQFSKLPKALKLLQEVDVSKLSPQIQELTSVMTPLGNVMDKVGRGFEAMPPKIQRYIREMDNATGATSRFARQGGGSIMQFLRTWQGKITTILFFTSRIRRIFTELTDTANSYIENMNLFAVTMGENTEAALKYAKTVENALGIDHNAWIKQQGIFKQITSGFGVAEEEANKMSQNLNQLVYDSASFFNTTVDEAMAKFESGMAGFSRPLRNFGYDISQAALQETLWRHGIDKSITELGRAAKAQITYIAIMEQSRNIMGDMARTIITPANAMRILNMEVERMRRAFGQALIPIVQAALPYLMALTQLLTMAGQALAKLTGYKAPKIDYSGMSVGPLEDVEDAFAGIEDRAKGATAAVKEFQNYLLGFDKMHVMPSDKGKAGGFGMAGGYGGPLDIDMPEYDFLKDLADRGTQADRIKRKILDVINTVTAALEPYKDLLKTLGRTLLVAFSVNTISKFAGVFNNLFGATFSKKVGGVVGLIGSIWLSYKGSADNIKNYQVGKIELFEYILNQLGIITISAGVAIGALKALGAPTGVAVAVGLIGAVVTGLYGAVKGIRDARKEAQLDKWFGEIKLTRDEVEALARSIATNDFTIRLRVAAQEFDKLQSSIENLETAVHNLERTEVLIKLGVNYDPRDYVSDIEAFMTGVQDTLKQFNNTVPIALDLTFGKDSKIGSKLIENFNIQSATRMTEYENLKNQLTEMLQDMIEEGASAVEINEAAQEIIGKMRDLYKQVEDFNRQFGETKFKLKYGSVDFGKEGLMGQLDIESYKEVLKELRALGEEDMEALLTNHALTLTTIMNDEMLSAQERHTALLAAEEEYYKEKMNIAARAADTINEQLLTDLDNLIEDWRSKTEGKTKVNQLIGGLFGFEGSTPEESKKIIEETFGKAFPTRADWTKLAYEIKQSIPPELRDANSDIWAALKPDAIGLKAVMMEALEKGVVPDEANMNKLKALMKAGVIAGDVDAIYLHIADELISSPERMKMIATVDGIGKDIPDTLALAIRANSTFAANATGEMMWWINGKAYEITPTLLENFRNMGIGLPNALSDGILAQLVENDPKNKGYIKTWLVDSYSNYLKLMGLPEMSAATKGVMADVFSNLSTYLADEDPMGAIAKAMGNNFTPEFKTWITDNFNYLVELINKTKEASKEVDKLSRYKWQGSGGVTIGFTPTKYATGGFPTTGELFYAREGGEVELVGRHGNQSMVANNQQIVTAIRQASAEGYVEGYVRTQGASGGRSDGDTIVVQIGNEVVYEGSLNHLRRQNQRAGRVLVPVRG
jgi:hypothetical protein